MCTLLLDLKAICQYIHLELSEDAPAVKPLQEQIYSGLGLHPQEMSPSLMPGIEFIWTKDGMKSSEQDPIHN